MMSSADFHNCVFLPTYYKIGGQKHTIPLSSKDPVEKKHWVTYLYHMFAHMSPHAFCIDENASRERTQPNIMQPLAAVNNPL